MVYDETPAENYKKSNYAVELDCQESLTWINNTKKDILVGQGLYYLN